MGGEYNGAGSRARPGLAAAIARPEGLLLDGATGTELEARGVRVDLPLWSTWGLLEAPDVLRDIHADYLRAGAEAVTTATFRTHARSLAAAGHAARAAELTALATRLARDAIELTERDAFVLGSAAPLEDCYEPARVPDDAALARKHASHASHLRRAGVDAVLVETINTLREGVAAARAAREAGLDVLVSFLCGPGGRLPSGEPLTEALAAVAEFEPVALGVNCLAPALVPACLAPLLATDRPAMVYANVVGDGMPTDRGSPAAVAADASRWARAGVRVVGGCCGTTPAHIAAIAAATRRGAQTVAPG